MEEEEGRRESSLISEGKEEDMGEESSRVREDLVVPQGGVGDDPSRLRGGLPLGVGVEPSRLRGGLPLRVGESRSHIWGDEDVESGASRR